MIEEAVGRLEPGTPQLITSPPQDPGAVTGLPIYLAVDGDIDAATGSVSAGPYTVTAGIEPTGLHISPGDGTDPFTCTGFGTIWQPGDRPGPDDCTHTYTHVPDRGTARLQVHVSYRATATVTGPDGTLTEDLGDLDGPVTTIDLPVRERRAVRSG